MAIHAHSTPAPARALLPRTDFSPAAIIARAEAFASTIATRVKARPPVEDHRSPAELLEEIRQTIEGEVEISTPLLSADVPHGGAPLACQADTPLLPLPAPLPSLQAALSRRRAIFGAVAFAAAPMAVQAAPVAVMATTAVTSQADALGAEFDRLSACFTAARTACRDAEARHVAPEIPDGLLYQAGDAWRLLGATPRPERQTGWNWWGYPSEIESLKALRLVYAGGEPDAMARARRDEIVMLAEDYRRAVIDAEERAGVTAASHEWEVEATAYFGFLERLVALRTADPAVMRLKARVVAVDLARYDGLDAHLSREIEDQPSEVETLALSLVRDMVAELGLAA